jgi:hypothetical protein
MTYLRHFQSSHYVPTAVSRIIKPNSIMKVIKYTPLNHSQIDFYVFSTRVRKLLLPTDSTKKHRNYQETKRKWP